MPVEGLPTNSPVATLAYSPSHHAAPLANSSQAVSCSALLTLACRLAVPASNAQHLGSWMAYLLCSLTAHRTRHSPPRPCVCILHIDVGGWPFNQG